MQDKGWQTGDRRCETRNGRQETEDAKQEMGDARQGMVDWKQKMLNKGWEIEKQIVNYHPHLAAIGIRRPEPNALLVTLSPVQPEFFYVHFSVQHSQSILLYLFHIPAG